MMAVLAPIQNRAAAHDFVAVVDARLSRLFAAERERWLEVDGGLAEVVDAMSGIALRGGKRMRALLAYWGYIGAGGSHDSPLIVDAGGALEMVHLAALIHDDVIDESAQRRGRPAAHVGFATRHHQHAWRGDARHFGDGVAILLGDLALFYAERLIADACPVARKIFNELRIEMAFGQYLDVAATAQGHVDIETATRIAVYKSAKYSVERPLLLGAALAGSNADLGRALSAFGIPLGTAFQLADDLLGVFGDPALTGKPVGDDLRQRKPTLLMAVSMPRLRKEAPELMWRYETSQPSGEDVRRIQSLLDECGCRQEGVRMVDDLVAAAVGAIDRAPLTAEARDALIRLAEAVRSRRS
jgi:geranylgeranyl diphosphate synthase type I